MSRLVLTAAICVAAVTGQTHVWYPQGYPVDCTKPVGYTVDALCTVRGETPLGSFVPPLAGMTWTDATFGGVQKLLTNERSLHVYSAISPFSATGKHVALSLDDGKKNVVLDPRTGTQLYTYVPATTILWDGSDDDVYYYVSGTKVMKYILSSKTLTTVIDYSASGHMFTALRTGGTGDITKDNWLAFWAPNEKQVCALDIDNVKTYCTSYTAAHPDNRVGWDFIDYALMSKGVDSVTGKRYVVMFATPALGVYSVDVARGRLAFEHRGPESPLDAYKNGNRDGICDPGERCLANPHADTVEEKDGGQYIVRLQDLDTPCGRYLVGNHIGAGLKMNVSTAQGGGRREIMLMQPCGDLSAWQNIHVGCARRAPYCAISTYPNSKRDPLDLTTPIPRKPYMSEIFVTQPASSEIRRLAQHRSIVFTTDGYWATSRAAMSHDASYVLFESNFGKPNEERSVVVPTGVGSDTQPPALSNIRAVVNGSSGATILWSTDEPAGASVEYGRTSSPSGTASAAEAAAVNHSVTIAGLTPGTTYYYRAISRDANGNRTVSALLSFVTAPSAAVSAISVNPVRIAGGTTSQALVSLSAPAPEAGLDVTLVSSNPSVLPNATVRIPAGAKSALATLSSTRVGSNVSLSVAANPQCSASVTVVATPVTALVSSRSSLAAGGTAIGTITIAAAAPAGGSTVNLTVSDTSVLSVPSAVIVPAGATSAVFTITAAARSAAASAIVTASAGDVARQTAVSVTPAVLSGLFVPKSITGGGRASGTVYLAGTAPAGGYAVTLTSGPALSVTSIVVPAGAKTASFSIGTQPSSIDVPATVTAVAGSVQFTRSTLVVPPALSGLYVGAQRSGATVLTGQVYLNGAAPAGGWTVNLSSSRAAVAGGAITIAAGSSSGTFRLPSQRVTAPLAVTITATANSQTKSATATLIP